MIEHHPDGAWRIGHDDMGKGHILHDPAFTVHESDARAMEEGTQKAVGDGDVANVTAGK